MNKWRFKQIVKDKYYSIVSVYNGKCLNYSKNGLFMQECNKNNKYEHFIIKNGNFCSRADETKCLDNNINVYPTVKRPKKMKIGVLKMISGVVYWVQKQLILFLHHLFTQRPTTYIIHSLTNAYILMELRILKSH